MVEIASNQQRNGVTSTVVHCDGNSIAAPTAIATQRVTASGELKGNNQPAATASKQHSDVERW